MSNAKKKKAWFGWETQGTKAQACVPNSSSQEDKWLVPGAQAGHCRCFSRSGSGSLCKMCKAIAKSCSEKTRQEAVCGRPYRAHSPRRLYIPKPASTRRFVRLGRMARPSNVRSTSDTVSSLPRCEDKGRK